MSRKLLSLDKENGGKVYIGVDAESYERAFPKPKVNNTEGMPTKSIQLDSNGMRVAYPKTLYHNEIYAKSEDFTPVKVKPSLRKYRRATKKRALSTDVSSAKVKPNLSKYYKTTKQRAISTDVSSAKVVKIKGRSISSKRNPKSRYEFYRHKLVIALLAVSTLLAVSVLLLVLYLLARISPIIPVVFLSISLLAYGKYMR